VLAQGAGWGGRDTVGGGTSCGKGIWSTRATLKNLEHACNFENCDEL
jgi:hypothetical protein